VMLISLCASALGIRRINEVLVVELAVYAGERVSETVGGIELGLASTLFIARRVAPVPLATAATVPTAATRLVWDHCGELGIVGIKRCDLGGTAHYDIIQRHIRRVHRRKASALIPSGLASGLPLRLPSGLPLRLFPTRVTGST